MRGSEKDKDYVKNEKTEAFIYVAIIRLPK